MVDTKTSGMTAVTTPATTDEFPCTQGTNQRRQTRLQLHTLENSEHFVVGINDDAVTPSLAFGDGNTGFYEQADNVVIFSAAAVGRLRLDSNGVAAFTSDGGILLDESCSDTNPTLVPDKTDLDTGLGADGSNGLTLIAGGSTGPKVILGQLGSTGISVFIPDLTVAPSSNPTGGGVLYSEGGALKWRGSSGTVTTIASA